MSEPPKPGDQRAEQTKGAERQGQIEDVEHVPPLSVSDAGPSP